MSYILGESIANDFAELSIKCKNRFASYFDENLLRTAFDYCIIAHEGNFRKNGLKYYTHPLSVAYILLDEIPLDMESVVAAMLHNVLDESDVYTYEDIKFTFGENIAGIVDGITRIKLVESQYIVRADQLDNYRGLLLTLFKDIRIILVKLADRLDNMRTLDYETKDNQLKLAKETLDIYSPFANRFGLTRIKFELEDLAFKYTNPFIYKQIQNKIKGTHKTRTEYVNKFKEPIIKRLEAEEVLSRQNIHYRINGRAKNIYSIYNKTIIRKKVIDELYDIFAIRIILDTDNPYFCYYVYGIISSMYKPIPDTFKDYISSPKSNGYSSLHTAVAGPENKIIEIQIRTEQMHKASEEGIAAHFRYKNTIDTSTIMENTQIQTWLDEVRDIFNRVGNEDPSKLLTLILNNRLADKIYVFTPANEFKELPNGSTVLDFAFEIHTDIGFRCLGAKVNGKFCPINHILNSGDKVEVLVSSKQVPVKKWLDYVITSKATTKLIDFFKKERNSILKKGKQLWNDMNLKYNFYVEQDEINVLLRKYNFASEDEFYIAIGNGSLNLNTIYPIIISNITTQIMDKIMYDIETTPSQLFSNLDNYTDKEFIFSDCCNPLPGDSIFGIKGSHRQIDVHNSYCLKYKKLLNTHPDDIILLDWEYFIGRTFFATLHITADDKIDIMEKIIDIIRCDDQNQIYNIDYEPANGEFDTTIGFKIFNNCFIRSIMDDIENIIGVKSVDRED